MPPATAYAMHMRHALRLAERGLGLTWPNPSVGAVIVKDGVIIGRGHTQRGGRPHAETLALAQAGEDARGATLYVTLEPCAHYGQTSPCTGAIISAGINRVVAAAADPHPLVAGKGFKALRDAGIEVVEGVLQAEAIQLNEGFFSCVKRGRPFVALKIAASLDGKIADSQGSSQWITGTAARRFGHFLRASHDAVLTGSETALADNPSLTCRLPGRLEDSPQRLVIDGKMRIPEENALFPAWRFTTLPSQDAPHVFSVEEKDGHVSLEAVLRFLGKQGVTRLLVEGGQGIASAFLDQGLVDRVYWFRAPVTIGRNGLDAIALRDHPLAQAPRYRLHDLRPLGEDVLEIWEQQE